MGGFGLLASISAGTPCTPLSPTWPLSRRFQCVSSSHTPQRWRHGGVDAGGDASSGCSRPSLPRCPPTLVFPFPHDFPPLPPEFFPFLHLPPTVACVWSHFYLQSKKEGAVTDLGSRNQPLSRRLKWFPIGPISLAFLRKCHQPSGNETKLHSPLPRALCLSNTPTLVCGAWGCRGVRWGMEGGDPLAPISRHHGPSSPSLPPERTPTLLKHHWEAMGGVGGEVGGGELASHTPPTSTRCSAWCLQEDVSKKVPN